MRLQVAPLNYLKPIFGLGMTLDVSLDHVVRHVARATRKVAPRPHPLADGKTYEQAVANARQVIEERIAAARKLGRPIPQPKGRLMYA